MDKITVSKEQYGTPLDNEMLEKLVNEFGDQMKQRLIEGSARGYKGWTHAEEKESDLWASGHELFIRRLLAAASQRRWIDVANYAAFLWNLEKGETSTDKQEVASQ